MMASLVALAGCTDSRGGVQPAPETSADAESGEQGAETVAAVSDAAVDLTAPDTADGPPLPPPGRDLKRDIVHMALHLDLAEKAGIALLQLAPTDTTAASFDVRGLKVTSVRLLGVDLAHEVVDGILDVGVPTGSAAPELEVRYTFDVVAPFSMQGWMPSGSTLIWPDYCGNLFPCHPDPADGATFELEVVGTPLGQTVVYAPAIPTPAPAYMLAFAVGHYSWTPLGTTNSGTEVGFWTTADLQADSLKGTANLLATVQWLEQTLGAYPFGPRVGPVSVDWGPFFLGGFEAHPFWHVARPVMTDTLTHAHEAAHGWFGDGIRLKCWEDLVLSEGLASYLAARSVEVLQGEQAGKNVFTDYRATLDKLIAKGVDPIALPDSCGAMDIEADLLFTKIPYMKGALFLRAVAALMGASKLDATLATFYQAHSGKAARMQELVDHLAGAGGEAVHGLADAWLRTKGVPAP